MTGWGQTGPLAHGGRPRHELHRDHRRPVRDGPGQVAARTSRPTWSATSAAGRRTSSSACSPRCSRPGISGEGQVVDAAIVDGTAHLNAMSAGLPGRRQPARGARGQPARRRHAVLRRLRDLRRPAHVGRARWSRSSTTSSSKLLDIEDAPDRYDFDRRPRSCAASSPSAFAAADPGRVVRGLRGHRRLRRADPPAHRGDGAPAHGGPRGVRRARGRPPAGARSALLPYAGQRSACRRVRRPAPTPARP